MPPVTQIRIHFDREFSYWKWQVHNLRTIPSLISEGFADNANTAFTEAFLEYVKSANNY